MNKLKEIVLRWGYWALLGVITITLISFTEKRQAERTCEDLDIQVQNILQNHFIDEQDVSDLMTEDRRKVILGLSQEAINLKQYERLVSDHQFTNTAQVYRTLKGDLKVRVTQRKPLARIFEQNQSGYVDRFGNVLPLSDNYTARVFVVTDNSDNEVFNKVFFHNQEGKPYLRLFNFIESNNFWRKQITELKISKKGKVEMLMQVGKQRVEFGYPTDIEDKFQRLEVFLKKILPAKGWNSYNKVNLEYKNQIVCE